MSIYRYKLRDDQWQLLQSIITTRHFPGTQGKDDRLFIEAVMFIVLNLYGWHELPAEFGKWTTIYMRFKRWTLSGMWHRLARGTMSDMTLHLWVKAIGDYGDDFLRRRKKRQDRKMVALEMIKK